MRSKVVSLLKKPMTGIIISVFVGFICASFRHCCRYSLVVFRIGSTILIRKGPGT